MLMNYLETSKISQTAAKVKSILTTLIETLDTPNDLEKLQKYLPSLEGQNIQGSLIELFRVSKSNSTFFQMWRI